MITVEEIKTWGPWLGALIVGALPVFGMMGKARTQRTQDRADLVKIAQEAAGAVIKDLRDEIDRAHDDRDHLRRRLEEVEDELADFRRLHDAMIAEKDAELTILRGENRQLRAMLDSHRRMMEANGLTPPLMSEQFWIVPPGNQPPRELEGVGP